MSDETMVPFDFPKDSPHIIKVIGVGGGGGNAVNHMYKEGIHDVTFVVCNTDNQALEESPVLRKLQLGSEGLGAGNRPQNRRRDQDAVRQIRRPDRPSADGGKRHPAQPLAGPERHRQRQTGKHFLRGMAHEFGRLRRGVPRRRVATYGRGSRPTGGHREGKPPSGGHRLPLADRLGERPRRGERGRSVRHVHRPRERAHRTSENGAEGTGDE